MRDESVIGDDVSSEEAADALAPLSFAQERLWFLDQVGHDPAAYAMPIAVALRGVLDADALERSLSEVVARHEALRTRFVTVGGTPVQDPVAARTVALDVVDAAGWTPGAIAAACGDLARERFDLASGSLLRARLLQRAADDHVLVLVVHHIAADAWSVRVLFDELATLYASFSAGGGSPLPEPELQYADFAVWQREWLRGPVLDEQLAHWRDRLDGVPTVLELPTDRPRPAVRSGSGALARFSLDAELAEGLRGLARGRRATLFMVLLAGFGVVLSRWSGREDLIVGTPVANRPRRELEGLIGFFVNTLPLRVRLDGDPAFLVLLDRVRDVSLGAFAHQDVPFERLVEELAPERSLSRAPLVQVVLALQNTAGGSALELPGLDVSPLEVDAGVAKFELTVSLEETAAGGLAGVVEYNRDLYDETTIHRLTGHLATVLAAAVADPSTPISRLPLLTGWERAWLLEQAGAPVAALGDGAAGEQAGSVHELVAARARATPGATALVADGCEISHAELHDRVLALAHHLRERGARSGEIVGICLPRGADMVVAILAVLHTGAAYLPVDPHYPAARIALVVRDASAALVVTCARLRDRLPSGPPAVVLDSLALPGPPPGAEPLPQVGPAAPMYVIHTSGSTGSPKGVAVPHRAVLALLTALDPVLRPAGPGEQEAWVAATSVSFDLSVVELFWTLSRGVTLVVADTVALRGTGTEDLVALLARPDVRYFQSTPSLLRLLLSAGGDDVLGEVATLVLGGEVIERSFFDHISRGGRRRVINGYGPTEATVYALLHVMTEPFATVRAPLGRPPAGTRVHVLGPSRDLQPVGVPGELAIGGVQVADGYFGRPAATAERFVCDPFDDDPGARMYLTGDHGVRDAHGVIHFLGRDDGQVKVRGFRIELAEIEEVLRGHGAVADAAVAVVAPGGAEPRLAAFVVPLGRPAPPATGDAAGGLAGELRDHLVSELPWFMVPATITVAAELPLTSSGKLDRAALPHGWAVRPDTGETYRPPAGELERTIGGIWAGVLGIDRVGASDSFFDIGGSSMLLVQVRDALEAALPRSVSLMDLFRHPTVEALARHLAADPPPAAVPVGGAAVRGPARPSEPESEAARRARLRRGAGRRRAATERPGGGAGRRGDAS